MVQPTTALAWEREIDDGQVSQGPEPARGVWSTHLCQAIDGAYDVLVAAEDIKIVIPDFSSLNRDQIVTKLAELFVRVAEYESSWDPACTSIDVNGSQDPDFLATGFFQLNVEDQSSFHTGTDYSAEELKDPLKNITAGIGIAKYIAETRKRITFIRGQNQGAFFETLMFDATYLTIDKILPSVWALEV